MKEPKTVCEAWQVLKDHGLEGKYCPHCDQFAQARVLLKQDEKISDLYEALWAIRTQFCKVDKLYSKDCDVIEQANKALAKAEGK